MKKFFLAVVLLSTCFLFCNAQATAPSAEQTTYINVITKRAQKIVEALHITDSVKFYRLRDIIVSQYQSLSAIHDTRNAKVKEIKNSGVDKAVSNAQIASIDSNVDVQLNKQHNLYLSKLSAELNPSQIDQVKDLMTYKILPLTYNAYLDELPDLTDAQKLKIKDWLIEAREHAIDAESSEKKHAWFGKYKGRINNYLSSQGYDMKKAGQDWQKRIKEKTQKG